MNNVNYFFLSYWFDLIKYFVKCYKMTLIWKVPRIDKTNI